MNDYCTAPHTADRAEAYEPLPDHAGHGGPGGKVH